MKTGFEPRRYAVAKECPCGKSNKDGKFAPFKGEEKYGKCHSCGDAFFPPEDNSKAPIVNKSQKYVPPIQLEHSFPFLQDDPLFRYFSKLTGEEEKVASHFRLMNVGRRNGHTVFWQVDQFGRVCQPKSFPYDEETGNRIKKEGRSDIMPEQTFNSSNGYFPCLFNLCSLEDDLPIILVESEKTATFAQYFTKEYTFMATGGSNGLSMDKAIPLRGRDIIIAVDADEAGRESAQKTKSVLEKLECRVEIVDSFPDRVDGYDLGDFVVDFAEDRDVVEKIFSNDFEKVFLKLQGAEGIDQLEEGVVDVDIDDLVYRYINDIKDRGISCNMRELDVAFKFKKGLIYTFTGWAGTGKSEITLFLAFLMSWFNGWKWILFAPESMSSNEEGKITVEDIYDQIVHTYWGKPADIREATGVTESEYREAAIWVRKHFTIIYPQKGMTTQDGIIKQTEYLIEKNGKYDGVIIDPWNNVVSSQRNNELIDEYTRRVIAEAKSFSIANRLSWIYVTHPSKVQQNKDGSLPTPDGHNIRGGMSFINGSDLLTVIDRPYYFMGEVEFRGKSIQGRNHPEVRFTTKKVKAQRLLQSRPNTIPLIFNRRTNRYENTHQLSPLDEAYIKYWSGEGVREDYEARLPEDDKQRDEILIPDDDKQNKEYEKDVKRSGQADIFELLDEHERENEDEEEDDIPF